MVLLAHGPSHFVFHKVPLHNFFPLSFPFFSVGLRIIQAFITRYTKDAAILQFLGERNDVKVKESDFPLVPALGGISCRSSGLINGIAFVEETLVPFQIHMPMPEEEKQSRKRVSLVVPTVFGKGYENTYCIV
jgi:hypothetical protein